MNVHVVFKSHYNSVMSVISFSELLYGFCRIKGPLAWHSSAWPVRGFLQT